ncbi:hypothetical protein Q4567_01450 [Aliiglaciecola sp. 2_MG-2023]|uniref:hypothetical protein n=1 Tax=unclassified Aliiglaciecola TaxID=2593648 RepID=UPI0026E4106C|nr:MULTISPECIES: hypothetical protein [unclassified Aliiglaciecola]MDO6709377.1 hypothetical protein [Aliiglaciecola sp. 2_MG-2023]MDO6750525.1 hypothetical protein [Aliiglaciecola sp. 1_MG-2023]
MYNFSATPQLVKDIKLPSNKVNGDNLNDFLRKLALMRNLHEIGLDDLTVNYSDVSFEQVSEIVRRYGVICILNAIPPEVAKSVSVVIENLCQQISQESSNSDKPFGEIRNGVWQKENVYANNMHDFCNYPRPIVNVRGSFGIDGNMFDMFNIDKMAGLNSHLFQQCLKTLKLPMVQAAVENNSGYRFSTSQVYRNHSVTNTRGYHIDNLCHTFKSFLYLTDVNNNKQGPYSYIPASNHLPYVHRLELRLTEKVGAKARDIWSSRYLSPVNFLAPAGSLILSDQSGIHRGIPQVDGELRVAMVGNFNRHRLQ